MSNVTCTGRRLRVPAALLQRVRHGQRAGWPRDDAVHGRHDELSCWVVELVIELGPQTFSPLLFGRLEDYDLNHHRIRCDDDCVPVLLQRLRLCIASDRRIV